MASGKSFLLANTPYTTNDKCRVWAQSQHKRHRSTHSNGMLASGGLAMRSCNSFLALSNLSGSAASTTYLRHTHKHQCQTRITKTHSSSSLLVTHTIELTPRQYLHINTTHRQHHRQSHWKQIVAYLSHIERNRGWPPISHSLIVTLPVLPWLSFNCCQSTRNTRALPLLTLRILKPTVGIMSSLNCPDYTSSTTNFSIMSGYGFV